MKKFIAILLSVAMILPMVLVPAFASEEKTVTAASSDSVFVEGEDSLIVFVTGIGQSFSYLFDESYTAEGAFENGTLQDYENYASFTRSTVSTSYSSFLFPKLPTESRYTAKPTAPPLFPSFFISLSY